MAASAPAAAHLEAAKAVVSRRLVEMGCGTVAAPQQPQQPFMRFVKAGDAAAAAAAAAAPKAVPGAQPQPRPAKRPRRSRW
jgi:hypothetical protein